MHPLPRRVLQNAAGLYMHSRSLEIRQQVEGKGLPVLGASRPAIQVEVRPDNYCVPAMFFEEWLQSAVEIPEGILAGLAAQRNGMKPDRFEARQGRSIESLEWLRLCRNKHEAQSDDLIQPSLRRVAFE